MILLLLTLLAFPCLVSVAYEFTMTGKVTTLLPTQHNLNMAYELVANPFADENLRTKFLLNFVAGGLALLALAVVINTVLY